MRVKRLCINVRFSLRLFEPCEIASVWLAMKLSGLIGGPWWRSIKTSRHREGRLTRRIGKRMSTLTGSVRTLCSSRHPPELWMPQIYFSISPSDAAVFPRTFKLLSFSCCVSAGRWDITSASLERFTTPCRIWPRLLRAFYKAGRWNAWPSFIRSDWATLTQFSGILSWRGRVTIYHGRNAGFFGCFKDKMGY